MPRGAAPVDPRRAARSLYWRGWPVSDVADELSLKRSTVQSWKDRDKWDDATPIRRIEEEIAVRLHVLIAKEKKSGHDFKEIDLLGRQMVTMARIRRFNEPDGHNGDLNEKVANRNAGPKKKAKRNHFTEEAIAKLRELLEQMFEYQLLWYSVRDKRTRIILKSRQIGATYYFALEALLSAVEDGTNQIFLSASKAQAYEFRANIVQFAAYAGVTLSGDPIILTSDLVEDGVKKIELHFLGTNYKTAQGRHGNFYFDEFFWVSNFEKMYKLASGMASHKHYRKTLMSTPSATQHEAYPYWTGERRNRNRKKSEHIKVDLSHAALKSGALGEDRVWRHIVNIEDAERAGCALFDIEELRDEYPPDEFANLYMCQFIDDSLSAFKFNDLAKCLVDSWVEWKGFEPLGPRPVGNLAVWAGYDPQESEEGDNAALTIGLPPQQPGGEFRILERHQLRGLDFEAQSQFCRAVFTKYNVTYFGVDASGVGAGVYQLVQKWFPRVTKIEYSIEVKAQLVMKAQNVIARGRLKFDAGWTDVVMAFLAIKKTLTRGAQITFKAGRSKDGGHADIAWSIMHWLWNEPLDGGPVKRGRAEILGGEDE
jgi:uncharacterized protein YjcR